MHAAAPISPDALGTAEGIANPYPIYRALRGPNPVRFQRLPAGPISGRKEPLSSWALLRHDGPRCGRTPLR